jgi:ubiquinone/menaquinone biosynthesis C-methylase UbiE
MSTNKKTVDWYNANAESYTDHVRNADDSIYHAYYEKPAMYAYLPALSGKRVLSLGCGSGEDTQYLLSKGAIESIGIDISTELINIATASYPDCTFAVMDMERLDFPDASFDFVYSSLAIHYIENWNMVFNEVYRLLKPGSFFLFSCGHPIRTAMDVIENNETNKLRQLSVKQNKILKTVEICGNYLERRSITDALPGGAVTTWHKPISEIIYEAKQAGFLLETFVEPQPLKEMEAVSKYNYDRLVKIPEFMIMRMVKLS